MEPAEFHLAYVILPGVEGLEMPSSHRVMFDYSMSMEMTQCLSFDQYEVEMEGWIYYWHTIVEEWMVLEVHPM
jgi:hypothetical protein